MSLNSENTSTVAVRIRRHLPFIIVVMIILPCVLPVLWFALSHLESLGTYIYHDTRGLTTYDDIDFSNTAVTDDDMKYVELLGATGIDLTNTDISDEGLRHLYRRPFMTVTITNTNITDEGIAELRRHCQRCTIFRDGQMVPE